MNDFYVYVYYHPISKEPIYVGKGKGDRYKEHLYRAYEQSKRRRTKFLNKLVQIFNDTNQQAFVEIHTNNLSEKDALDLEIDLIAKFGRKDLDDNGILYNRTIGGDGISGYKWTSEQKQKFSEQRKAKGHKMTSNTKKALYAANTGRKMPRTAIEASAEKHAKNWCIQNPDGIIFEFKNLSKFCKDNNLKGTGILRTLISKQPVSRGPNTGWMLISEVNSNCS